MNALMRSLTGHCRKLRDVACAAFALVYGLGVFATHAAHAEIGVTATSEQLTYVRGKTNTFVFHLALYSEVFETADNIHFHFPEGVAVSAARYLDGNHTCPDALLLVLGMGTNDGGWFNPGHPSSCGYFFVSRSGDPQTFSIDADIPAGYVGDLPVLVSVEGDGCCDPPPHEASVRLSFADAASPATWTFDDVAAPGLPVGWSSVAIEAGIAWATMTTAGADSAPNAAYAPTPAQQGESILTSPSLAIDSSGGELRFRHRFATERNRDGGVIEISIDGDAYQDIVSAGGVFGQGAYNGAIRPRKGCSRENPLQGRKVWSGTQAEFTTVAIVLPPAAAGHQAQFRWRLGTDCAGQEAAPNGWWIDGVAVVSSVPLAAIGPDKLAISLDQGAQRTEILGIGNIGGGVFGYTVTTAAADGDCKSPASVSWLQVNADGVVAGDDRTELPVRIDSGALATGNYAALICVTTTSGSEQVLSIPVSLEVTSGTCQLADRVFANGFDDLSDGRCGTSLRTFTRRDAFLSQVADGYTQDHYTGLRTGDLHGPIEFGNGTFAYSVFTQDDPLNASLRLYAGAGVLSTASSADQVTLTFFGAPVTALGGNFWGGLFFNNTTSVLASTTIVLTLGDGSRETFTSNGLDSFRGFISSAPIQSLSIATPDIDADGDLPWGVIDHLVVGRAR